MGKRVPPVNEAAEALHSDTSAKISKDQEKDLRAKAIQKSNTKENPVSEVSKNSASKTPTDDPSALFQRIRERIQHAEQKPANTIEAELAEKFWLSTEQEIIEHEKKMEDPPTKGEFTKLLRLEIGKGKLMVNQKKITEKVHNTLIAIEAADKYLQAIALKIMSRKHCGIMLDMGKKEETKAKEKQNDPETQASGKKTKLEE